MYSIDDPKAMRTLYAISSPLPKSAWYEAFGDPQVPNHNLFSTRDRAFHAGMRRKLGSLYAMSAIKSYEPYVDEGISLLQQQLDRFAEDGQAVDMQHWMQCYAFDVIGKITVKLPFILTLKSISMLTKGWVSSETGSDSFGLAAVTLTASSRVWKTVTRLSPSPASTHSSFRCCSRCTAIR